MRTALVSWKYGRRGRSRSGSMSSSRSGTSPSSRRTSTSHFWTTTRKPTAAWGAYARGMLVFHCYQTKPQESLSLQSDSAHSCKVVYKMVARLLKAMTVQLLQYSARDSVCPREPARTAGRRQEPEKLTQVNQHR